MLLRRRISSIGGALTLIALSAARLLYSRFLELASVGICGIRNALFRSCSGQESVRTLLGKIEDRRCDGRARIVYPLHSLSEKPKVGCTIHI